MEFLAPLTPGAYQWKNSVEKAREAIIRAATLQAAQFRISSPVDEARRLAILYDISRKRRHWREYGDIAFHLSVVYPPDLAFAILYAFRDQQNELGYDPVTYVLKAVEELHRLRTTQWPLQLEAYRAHPAAFTDSEERARRGAKLIAREISGAPLRWASGILSVMDPIMKPFVLDELRSFNPNALDILSKSHPSWVLTRAGLKRLLNLLWRLLFGKSNDL